MPTNHGIYQKLSTVPGQRVNAAEAMVFRYGIRRIFDALKAGHSWQTRTIGGGRPN